jgi:hypothetical protein
LWIKGEYYDALPAVELVAKGGLDRGQQASPFDRLDWFRLVQAQNAAGRALIVRARSEGSDAWLFLQQTAPGRLSALATRHTQRFAPIFVGGPDALHRRRLMRAIAARLRRPSLGIGRIALPPLDRADADLIARAFRRAGWVAVLRPAAPGLRVATIGQGFDEYLEGRPDRLRATIEGEVRGVPLDFEVADRFSPALWTELEALARETADEFLRAFAEHESAEGALRIGIARRGGEAVAAQLWTVSGGIATAHLLAQAPRGREAESGAQLTATMVRYLLNVDHAAALDFGPGGQRWKTDWADESLPRARVDLLNPRRPSAWAAIAAAAASALVRRGSLD